MGLRPRKLPPAVLDTQMHYFICFYASDARACCLALLAHRVAMLRDCHNVVECNEYCNDHIYIKRHVMAREHTGLAIAERFSLFQTVV